MSSRQLVDTAGSTLTCLEIVGGMVFGLDDMVGSLPSDPEIRKPQLAIEAVIRTALQSPPCIVSFSGGRDSSALLALATAVARRHGYPLPVPVTLDFRHDEEANEEAWQVPIIQRLGLQDWVRLNAQTLDLDAVGAIARKLIQSHGLLWPFNAHFHLPIVEMAAGGSLITGFGGDELANSSATARAEQAIHRTRPLRRSDVLSVGLALAPSPIRAMTHRRRHKRELHDYTWLTPHGKRRLGREWARDTARLRYGWPRAMQSLWRGRYFSLCRKTFDLMGSEHGVAVYHPFVDQDVLAAFQASGPTAGYGGRKALLETLFGPALPPEVGARVNKAAFTNPLWTKTARDFARSWHPSDIYADLVDITKLRQAWLSSGGDARVTLLLQDAWLRSEQAASAAS